MSESETELMKPEKSNALDEYSDESDNAELSTGSQDSEENINKQEIHANEPPEERPEMVDKKQTNPPEQSNSREEEADGVRERRFLDLNELAPGSGFDDGPTSMRDEDTDDL
ncbi:UNVERIFIED_CONTAM: hypothetical protein Slati_3522900 [Sesamum latifolium]